MHFCLVGCGKIALTHARILKRLERFVPDQPIRLSFASRDATKAERYRSQFSGELAFDSYEKSFLHGDVDVAVICTPNDSHRDLAVAALEHGKHVIIEKPIACTTADADQILAAAKRVSRSILVAENHRYRPNVLEVDRILRSGDLGTIKLIRIHVMRMHQFKPDEWRANRDHMGGGILIDGGIHWANVLLTLGRCRPLSISAYQAAITNRSSPQEDSIVVTCRFENGVVGVLVYSWGVEGAFPMSFFAVHGSAASVYSSNAGRFGLLKRRVFRPLLFRPFRDWQGYEAMWKDFLSGLANGDANRCLVNGDVGRRDLAFVEAAYRSVKSHS